MLTMRQVISAFNKQGNDLRLSRVAGAFSSKPFYFRAAILSLQANPSIFFLDVRDRYLLKEAPALADLQKLWASTKPSTQVIKRLNEWIREAGCYISSWDQADLRWITIAGSFENLQKLQIAEITTDSVKTFLTGTGVVGATLMGVGAALTPTPAAPAGGTIFLAGVDVSVLTGIGFISVGLFEAMQPAPVPAQPPAPPANPAVNSPTYPPGWTPPLPPWVDVYKLDGTLDHIEFSSLTEPLSDEVLNDLFEQAVAAAGDNPGSESTSEFAYNRDEESGQGDGDDYGDGTEDDDDDDDGDDDDGSDEGGMPEGNNDGDEGGDDGYGTG